MPKHPRLTDDKLSSRPTHYQHCLYLIAEAERMIDRAAAGWSPSEATLIKSRLVQIAERLTSVRMLSR
jgi:hypothetical protein